MFRLSNNQVRRVTWLMATTDNTEAIQSHYLRACPRAHHSRRQDSSAVDTRFPHVIWRSAERVVFFSLVAAQFWRHCCEGGDQGDDIQKRGCFTGGTNVVTARPSIIVSLRNIRQQCTKWSDQYDYARIRRSIFYVSQMAALADERWWVPKTLCNV